MIGRLKVGGKIGFPKVCAPKVCLESVLRLSDMIHEGKVQVAYDSYHDTPKIHGSSVSNVVQVAYGLYYGTRRHVHLKGSESGLRLASRSYRTCSQQGCASGLRLGNMIRQGEISHCAGADDVPLAPLQANMNTSTRTHVTVRMPAFTCAHPPMPGM